MRKRAALVLLVLLVLLAGCAEFRERQRLKTEMMREAVGMMKGMNGGGLPPGFKVESIKPTN